MYGMKERTVTVYMREGTNLNNPKAMGKAMMAKSGSLTPELGAMQHMTICPGPGQARASIPVTRQPDKSAEERRDAQRTKTGEVVDDPGEGLFGFNREYVRLQHEADLTYKAWRETKNAVDKKLLWDVWEGQLEALGKLAKIAPTADRESGNLIRKDEVEAEWTRLFFEVKTTLDQMPRRLSTHPIFRRLNDPVTVEQTIQDEVNRALRALQGDDDATGES